MSVKEALREFELNNQKVVDSLKKLHDEIKKQTSLQVQHFMLSDQFERANKMMKSLEQLIRLELNSNAEQISENIHHLFEDFGMDMQKNEEAQRKAKTEYNEELSFVEREILEEIGYSVATLITDLKKPVPNECIHVLEEKGYLLCETVHIDKTEVLKFKLSDKGKHYFQNRYGFAPMERKENKPFCTMSDLELQLRLCGYNIVKTNEQIIEVKMHNKSCYMLLPNEDFEQQLDAINSLKNIGYVCEDERQVEEIFEKAKAWVTINKEKSKFLTINCTTLESLKNNQSNPFRTVRF